MYWVKVSYRDECEACGIAPERFGPFETSSAAEQCVIGIAARTDVRVAWIVEDK
jgi:hypothetical protein